VCDHLDACTWLVSIFASSFEALPGGALWVPALASKAQTALNDVTGEATHDKSNIMNMHANIAHFIK
jgi:hypothetical protein